MTERRKSRKEKERKGKKKPSPYWNFSQKPVKELL